MHSSALYEQFAERGLRRTPQRLAVWRAFAEKPGRTIRQVAGDLAEEGIGQATVYRAVRALEGAGLLLGYASPRGEVRYVAVLGHAHVLVCRRCGEVTSLHECQIEDYERRLQSKTGYQISGHTLAIYGICPRCLQEEGL